MESEERRALVLLGITAVLAAMLATMYALIWTNQKKLEDFFFNFPCSAVPHLTVYDVPLLEQLIRAWILYAIFAFFYFSADWFQSRRGERFRTFCHVFAAFFMGFYFITVVWMVPGLYVLIVWIPSQFGALYYVAVVIGLTYTQIRFIEMATGTRDAVHQQLVRFWNRTGEQPLKAARHQLMLLLARLWNKYSNRLPHRLRNRLVRLRKFIRFARRRRKLLGGRAKTILIYAVGVIAIVLALLYQTYCR
jgi:hypothetical protein